MFRSKMTWGDRLGLAAVGTRILANVPFLEMSPDNRWANRSGPSSTTGVPTSCCAV